MRKLNMTSNFVLENPSSVQFRDLLFRKVWESGCACATDLAGQLGGGITAAQLIPILEDLVAQRALRHKKKDPKDSRNYDDKYQVVYEPVK